MLLLIAILSLFPLVLKIFFHNLLLCESFFTVHLLCPCMPVFTVSGSRFVLLPI